MAEQEVAALTAPAEVTETETKSPTGTDLKRKLDDLEPEEAATDVKISPPSDLPKEEFNLNTSNEAPDAKKPRLEDESDGSALENGHEVQKDTVAVENAAIINTADVAAEDVQNEKSKNIEAENSQIVLTADIETDDVKHVTVDNPQMGSETQDGDARKSSDETVKAEDTLRPSEGDPPQPVPETQSMSRKMEVPNSKVGVLIGRAGETIKYLQMNSRVKIHIARDTETNPDSATRPVELVGTLENIIKAEKLIKDVIAEADAGGSPSLVARGIGTEQATGPSEEIQILVPNERVGMIIGKGGQTIKNLQTRSGARIQLIPQQEGDQSKERSVRVTGDKKQIEAARDMLKELMSQPVKSSSHSRGYNQQSYHPRGPPGSHHWGARNHPTGQSTGYGNQQRGAYPSHNPQYMPQTYGGYPQQTGPRGNFNTGWDQRSNNMQTPQSNYAHRGHGPDSSAPTAVSNFGQPQGPEYGQQTYSQSVPSQQNYGPGYGGHEHAQPGVYPQQVATQSGYVQQPYSQQPTYGMPLQATAPPTYGPPRASQPGEIPYQNQTYGTTVPSQQPYPYASGGPSPQTYPYNTAAPASDGYNQPPTHSVPAPVYPQPGAQSVPNYGQPTSGQVAPGYAQGGAQSVPNYGQPTSGQMAPGYAQGGAQSVPNYGQPTSGQVAPGYAQGGQSGGYGTYSSQPGYAEQPLPNNAGYGYQGPDTGYGSTQAAYVAQPPNAQTNYVQPASNQATPQQSGPYATVPGSATGFV